MENDGDWLLSIHSEALPTHILQWEGDISLEKQKLDSHSSVMQGAILLFYEQQPQGPWHPASPFATCNQDRFMANDKTCIAEVAYL